MGMKQEITTHERTEAGDIGRSLEGLVKSQFTDRDFMSIITATRYDRIEIEANANLHYINVISRIMGVTKEDIDNKDLIKYMTKYDYDQMRDAYVLKTMMEKSPWVVYQVRAMSFMYMYSASLQSLDGLSRLEGTNMVTGATKKILGSDEVGFGDKLRRRLLGKDIAYLG